MNSFWLDIPVFLLLLFGIFKGWINGFVKEVISLFALIIALWAGFRLAFLFSNYYKTQFHLPEKGLPVIAFLSAFLLALALVLALGYALRFLLHKTIFSLPDHLLGATFGLLKMGFLLGALLSVLIKAQVLSPRFSESTYACKVLPAFSEKANHFTVALIPHAKNVITDLDSLFLSIDLENKKDKDTILADDTHHR